MKNLIGLSKILICYYIRRDKNIARWTNQIRDDDATFNINQNDKIIPSYETIPKHHLHNIKIYDFNKKDFLKRKV